MPTRAEAYALLTEYTQNPGLIKHALAVEAAMRAYARRFGEDEDLWGITGLLHDFDYERWPNAPDHPLQGARILAEKGYPQSMIEAIQGHATYTGVPRRTRMAKALYAVDELTGFITAVALVRPNKDLQEVAVSSVKKKFKDKAFARGVNREDIFTGARELGVDLDDHIAFVIQAMTAIAPELGLAGGDAQASQVS
ncbi:MAG: HDIG domain-containing protein [Firmicutes bacterium]|nr:HDIG domain-containing protein [Bacillota bacterium]